MKAQEPKVPGETVFGFLMVGVSIFLLWQAYSISGLSSLSSAGVFPMSAAFIMLVFSCVTVVDNRKKAQTEPVTFASFRAKVIPNLVSFMIALIIAYAVLLESIGFLLTSFSFLVIAIFVLYRNSLARTLFISALSILVIYAIFRLAFSVVLPEGIIPEGDILATISRWFV